MDDHLNRGQEQHQTAIEHQQDEVLVIVEANASVEPGAMMVSSKETTTAETAMTGSRWLKALADRAKFEVLHTVPAFHVSGKEGFGSFALVSLLLLGLVFGDLRGLRLLMLFQHIRLFLQLIPHLHRHH
jgi:hypothetical protein